MHSNFADPDPQESFQSLHNFKFRCGFRMQKPLYALKDKTHRRQCKMLMSSSKKSDLKSNSWKYNFVEISGHNLESSQTWCFRTQCLHYKVVSNHFCSRRDVEMTVKSKENILQTFVPIKSKNSASRKGLCGSYLSVWGPPPPPPRYKLFTYMYPWTKYLYRHQTLNVSFS